MGLPAFGPPPRRQGAHDTGHSLTNVISREPVGIERIDSNVRRPGHDDVGCHTAHGWAKQDARPLGARGHEHALNAGGGAQHW